MLVLLLKGFFRQNLFFAGTAVAATGFFAIKLAE
jgi:hypothetical protein